jgi:hypothetical protein
LLDSAEQYDYVDKRSDDFQTPGNLMTNDANRSPNSGQRSVGPTLLPCGRADLGDERHAKFCLPGFARRLALSSNAALGEMSHDSFHC